MAEGKGFEPLGPVKGQRFSRPPHSTTLPSLRAEMSFYQRGPYTSTRHLLLHQIEIADQGQGDDRYEQLEGDAHSEVVGKPVSSGAVDH